MDDLKYAKPLQSGARGGVIREGIISCLGTLFIILLPILFIFAIISFIFRNYGF